jgi:hypothetical protein
MNVPRPKVPRCVKCGSTRKIEMHHIGGRNHIAWFLVPLCRDHHVRLTVLIEQAGGKEIMQYTDDEAERKRRVRLAVYIFLWFLEYEVGER